MKISKKDLHGQRNVPLAEEREKGNGGGHILVTDVASERPEQRFRVYGRLAYLACALCRPDAGFCLHPVVQASPVDPPQLAPAVTRVYQVVRQERAVLAVADATRRLLTPAVVDIVDIVDIVNGVVRWLLV